MSAWQQIIQQAAPRPWELKIERNGAAVVRDALGTVIMEIVGDDAGERRDLDTAALIVCAVNAYEPAKVADGVEVAVPAFVIHEADGDRVVDPRNSETLGAA